jgi:hypothetical protein
MTEKFKGDHLYDLNLAKLKQGVIVYFHYYNLSGQYECMLAYYDERLKLIKEMPIAKDNKLKNCFAAYEDNIFILSNPLNQQLRTLSIYDLNLTLVQTIGQSSNATLPFYFPSTISQMAVSREYFLLLDFSNELRIVSRIDGTLFKQFKIAADSLFIYLDEFILSHASSTLYCYDFNGKIYNEKNLTKLNNTDGLMLDVSSWELTKTDRLGVD